MVKLHKRKRHIELNSSDSPRLDKRTKRSFEQSDRDNAKRNIRKELDNILIDTDKEDRYYELEMDMAMLCYELGELDTDHKCTCPGPTNEELAEDHINYLRQRIGELLCQKN